jgi:hypothetical protein
MIFQKFANLSIILLFSIFFSFTNAANKNEFENATDCGIENGVVKMFSWDICEQDFAFRIFYKLLPDVFEDQVFPIVNSKYLSNVKALEDKNLEVNRAYQSIILKIAEIMVNLSLLFGMYMFMWHAGLALLRTATEGSFLGKDYNGTQTMIKYGLIIFLLLPVGKGLVVAHWIILLLIMFSIAFGNLFYGLFLNFQDMGADATNVSANRTTYEAEDTDEKRLKEFQDNKKYDHNYFYSVEIVKSFLKISTCKVITEKFIFENNISKINVGNKDLYLGCSVESVLNAQILNRNITSTGFLPEKAFSIYKTQLSNLISGGSEVEMTSGLKFGKNIKNSCANIEGIYNYSCGEINVNVPQVTHKDTLNIMNEIGFYDSYADSSSQIMASNGDSSVIEGIATTGWSVLSTKLIDKLAENVNGEKKLSPADETVIKNVSYNFHQLLMNDAMIGSANISNNAIKSPATNKIVSNYFSKLIGTTAGMITSYCTKNKELILKSENLKRYLGDFDKSLENNLSSACTELPTLKVSGIKTKGKDEYIAANATLNTTVKQEQQKIMKLVLDVYNKREGIEVSLYKSLKSVSKFSLTAQMRKIGLASAGNFLLKLIKEKDIDNKFMHSIRNSLSFDSGVIDSRFIGKEYIAEKENVSSTIDNPNFLLFAEYYAPFVDPLNSGRKDLRMADISSSVSGLFDDSLYQAEKEDEFISRMIETISNPLGNFKQAVGIGANKDLNKEVVVKCMEDLKKCPIPLENPIKGLSDFGHSLVSTSSNLIALSLTLSFTSYAKEKYKNYKINHDKGGSIEKGKAVNEGLGKKIMGGVGGALASMVNVTELVLSAIFNILLLILSVGVFFAYIIPLVPFLMFTFTFLSWVTICLLTFFIFPMWVVFNLKMTESQNGNSEMYMSGYNIGLQILFRPALLIIALVTAWSLFKVAFLAINLTILPLMYSVLIQETSNFSISSIIDKIMLILIYGIIVYITIKFVFSFMYEITNKLFESMNVKPIDDKASASQHIMETAVKASVLQFMLLNDISKDIKGSVTNMKNETTSKTNAKERDDEIDLLVKDKMDNRYSDNKPSTDDKA